MCSQRHSTDRESRADRLVTRRTALKTLGAVGVLAGGLSVGAPVAQARRGDSTPIDSCTTITKPGRYHLVNDIVSTEDAPCIEIQSSDVTLDGRGYELRGTKTARRAVGVLVYNEREQLSNVMVKNLVVSDWDDGGIALRSTVDCTVANNRIDNCSTGVVLRRSRPNTEARVVSNVITNSGTGIGLNLARADIARNTVKSARFSGISLFASTATIHRNVVEGSGYAGFELSVCNDSRLTNNESRGNRFGIVVTFVSKNNSLVNNIASDNDEYGIFLDALSDRPDDATSGNRLVNNEVNNNGDDGINLGEGGNNRLVRNTVRNNGGDGIELDRSDQNTLVANVVCDNAGEQIIVRDRFPTGVISNTFRANKTDCSRGSRGKNSRRHS